MPSPFPGMDPFIEAQKWSGFHHVFIAELSHRLVALLRPRYDVDPEERIYVETAEPVWPEYRPDAVVTRRAEPVSARLGAVVLDIEPRIFRLPMPTEEREPYLVIRKTGEREVVTVIELLSPTNKRSGSDGRKEYLAKRQSILQSRPHLVEIDLLLGGQRLPMEGRLKPGTDYCAVVCRASWRPDAEVFEWTLRERLPRIPIPLANGDPDAILDLQAGLDALYDRSGYDYSLDYGAALPASMRQADPEWISQQAAKRLA